jgi:hypothetical protein
VGSSMISAIAIFLSLVIATITRRPSARSFAAPFRCP